jgi:2-iminobutanoate/2-iminopropanoate deaminase
LAPAPPAAAGHAHAGACRGSGRLIARDEDSDPRSEIATANARASKIPRMGQSISTAGAPKAIGPYAQAVVVPAGRMVFCSGQIPLDPATGEMVGASDVRVQTKRVLDNLGAVLGAAGASFASVVKTTIYLADLQDFGTVNEIYAGYFGKDPPARATVQAAGLPKGALIEIDAIAVVEG